MLLNTRLEKSGKGFRTCRQFYYSCQKRRVFCEEREHTHKYAELRIAKNTAFLAAPSDLMTAPPYARHKKQ
jgi:hypothetical protein